jgi:hypothetical protein
VLLVRVEAVGRLVEDQDLGIVQDRLREADAALEALRQRVDRLIQHLAEMQPRDDVVDALLPARALEAAHVGDEVEEGEGCHLAVTRRTLGQIADLRLRLDGLLLHVEAADPYAAAGGREESRDESHRGRLSRAVRAEKAEHFARLDGEGHVVHRRQMTVALREVRRFYHRQTAPISMVLVSIK